MPYRVVQVPDQLPVVEPGHLAYVESIIGGGKTTYCNQVGPRLNFRVFKEHLDHERLDRFYKQQKQYAFHFQIHVLHQRMGIQLLAACEALYSDVYSGAIVDRSIFGDVPFARLHARAGNIEAMDWVTYQISHMNMKFMIWPPTTLIYLSVEPEIAYERIRKRMEEEGRPYEDIVDLAYLNALRNEYELLVEEAQSGKFPWGHAVKIQYSDWNPATRTKDEWDAVAAGLRRRLGIEHVREEEKGTGSPG